MNEDLNSVKTAVSTVRQYHHGALRQALLEAAESVIAERGLDRFSLRETARRAGVSPAAPAHHFGDSRGLLTALAAEALRRFGDALEAAGAGKDRIARIRAQGMAYVRFALAEPALFDLMWRHALIDATEDEYRQAGARAFRILDDAVRGDAAAHQGASEKSPSSIAAWSIVHGFARLARDGAFGGEPGDAERATDLLLPAVLDHLSV